MVPVLSRFERLPDAAAPMLPYGNGRSYGDVCQNDGGTLLDARALDRFIAFDDTGGVLECEAGVLLSQIIDCFAPRGWFPPVTPGTAFVTVGGAIANDVHGKNHHRAGSFGHHLLGFELLRSDGEVLQCSPQQNAGWFAATLGGLGLTGLIRRARLRLRRIESPWIAGDSRRFATLEEFFALSQASDVSHEYTVAWIDCAARGARLGRGVFMRGNHAAEPVANRPAAPIRRAWRLPLTPPISPINGFSARAFSACYFHRPAAQRTAALWHYQPFLYPLDGVREWNRIYGPHGFFQYQCVLPEAEAPEALTAMLRLVADSGQGSFVTVLKRFGALPSLGLLSFPRPGVTLALDVANRGAPSLALLDALDGITRAARGAVYPAKDARMAPAAFREYFPAWQQFAPFVDPKFSSSFWRRVTASSA
jgi:FAD/FMN-containing dehydrogenase